MKFRDYYADLEVEPDADGEAIKKAYRRLARRTHPDVAKEPGAEQRFKEISEAYQTLSDPEKRRAYDDLGRHPNGEEFQPSPDWDSRFWQGSGQRGGPQDLDLADLFAQMGFGGSGRTTAQATGFPIRGQDLEVASELTLEQAAHGTEVSFSLKVPRSRAHGRGETVTRSGTIRVPRGVADGERLRVPGRGGEGHSGGAAGDLYVEIHLRPHPLFRPVGHDLYLELPIAPWEAALGAEIDVPTLDGVAKVNVRPGMRNGQKLRLAGKGLPHRKQGAGDLYGVIQIVMPQEISEPERQLYRELAKASPFHPRQHLEVHPSDG